MPLRPLRQACLVLAVACGGTSEPPPPPPAPAPVAAATGPFVPDAAPAPTSGRFDATDVRVAWRGAAAAPPSVTRDEAEALRIARSLLAEARAGRDLAEIARAASDAPSGRRGGRLGVFEAGTFDPALEAAVAAVEPGALAPLVRAADGFHVLRREAVEERRVVWASWAWRGAQGARVGRDRAAAEVAAVAAVARLRAGEPPSALGADVASPDGGELLGRAQWPAVAEAAAFGLGPGEVVGPVALPTGFLIVGRR